MNQLVFDFGPPPPPTFDTFIDGRNAEVVSRLRSLAGSHGEVGEFAMYLWGVSGSGRTHLLRAAVDEIGKRGLSGRYIACDVHTRFDESLAGSALLAIDDVDALAPDAQIALFNLYNARRDASLPLLVAGSAPPARLALRADLRTRLSWGLAYQVHALSDLEKHEALARHARTRGFALDAEVGEYLLRRVPRDLPSLLALLEALDRYSLATKRPVTVRLVRDLLSGKE